MMASTWQCCLLLAFDLDTFIAIIIAEKSCRVMLIFCPLGTDSIQGVSADPHPVASVTVLARYPEGAVRRAKSDPLHCAALGQNTTKCKRYIIMMKQKYLFEVLKLF